MYNFVLFVISLLVIEYSYGKSASMFLPNNPALYKSQTIVLVRQNPTDDDDCDSMGCQIIQLEGTKCLKFSKNVMQKNDRITVTINNAQGSVCDPYTGSVDLKQAQIKYEYIKSTRVLSFTWVNVSDKPYMIPSYDPISKYRCDKATVNCIMSRSDEFPYIKNHEYKVP